MITIELDETPRGNIITVISGIDGEKYDLRKVKKALKKLTNCQKTKLTDTGEILLLGSYIKRVNEFITQIGFQ
jgi:translation initiation factor 1 (eIF-1/SUI1)